MGLCKSHFEFCLFFIASSKCLVLTIVSEQQSLLFAACLLKQTQGGTKTTFAHQRKHFVFGDRHSCFKFESSNGFLSKLLQSSILHVRNFAKPSSFCGMCVWYVCMYLYTVDTSSVGADPSAPFLWAPSLSFVFSFLLLLLLLLLRFSLVFLVICFLFFLLFSFCWAWPKFKKKVLGSNPVACR